MSECVGGDQTSSVKSKREKRHDFPRAKDFTYLKPTPDPKTLYDESVQC